MQDEPVRPIFLGFGLCWIILSVSCGNETPSSPTPREGTPPRARGDAAPTNSREAPLETSAAADGPRSYPARGIITDLPGAGDSVVVRHEAIPGFMPKMTMEFSVRDSQELRGLAVGDAITFQLHVDSEQSWITDLKPTGTAAAAPPTPDPAPAALLQAHRAKLGDPVPDVELQAEEGRKLMLSSFRGQALALTFIFTRCPLPDYCPRMNQRFSAARAALRARVGGPTNWQFLSVSFDPEFDVPQSLRTYAAGWRGEDGAGWLFAVASAEALATLAPPLDFRFAREGGGLVHNLRTVVIDPRGRLYRTLDGNTWTAETLVQALEEAARQAD